MSADMTKLSGVDISEQRKGILVTPELCIGCRGCQSACKEWNKLPGDRTVNRGSYENPPDLNVHQYNKIRFVEVQNGKGLEWLFVSQRCMHCGNPGCVTICPSPGALTRTNFGAVVFNEARCIGCKLCRAACPFDVPRYGTDDKVAKCHMCFDRVASGLDPACTKTCPSGALTFGERGKLIAGAKKAGFATIYGENDLLGLGVMYALKEPPEHYGFSTSPGIPPSVAFWRSVLKPLAIIGLGASVAAAAAHYLTYGPKEDGEGGEES